MALVKCTECGHEVSDKAVTCPHCGCPVEKTLICEECGQQLSANDMVCPHCGCPLEKERESVVEVRYTNDNISVPSGSVGGQRKWNVLWIIMVIVVLLIVALWFIIGGYTHSDSPLSNVYNTQDDSIGEEERIRQEDEIYIDTLVADTVVADTIVIDDYLANNEEYGYDDEEMTDEEYENAHEVANQSEYASMSFGKIGEVFDFIRPSKTFSGPKGNIEIRCERESDDEVMTMYFNGIFLSDVGFSNPGSVAKGNHAQLAIRSSYRQVTFIIHLPDANHSQPYFYFEPTRTTTDGVLARAFNYPITEQWEYYEPYISGDKARLAFGTSDTKPSPVIYNMR